jgi:hypothetical protein
MYDAARKDEDKQQIRRGKMGGQVGAEQRAYVQPKEQSIKQSVSL